MWLDEICAGRSEANAIRGRVSIGGKTPAVESDSELRNLKIIRCGGALRIPAAQEEQLVLRCDNGEYDVLGVTEGGMPEGMEAGEIYIETKNAAVLIKNSGRVIVTGELEVNGSLSVNGRNVDGA